MIDIRETQVLSFIKQRPESSSKEIHEAISISISYATVKRILQKLKSDNLLDVKGQGKGTKYIVSSAFDLLHPIDLNKYFEKEIDERQIFEGFNLNIIVEVLAQYNVFNENELITLTNLQNRYLQNISQLSTSEYNKELNRLAIDLSWKSSQIEGNTYSLLETERLLKDKETASGKTKEEAIMLLNHKEAIDFITNNPDYLIPLSKAKVEDID